MRKYLLTHNLTLLTEFVFFNWLPVGGIKLIKDLCIKGCAYH